MFLRFLLIFFVLCIACPLVGVLLGIPFGYESYWQIHGVLFLVGLTFFPRLTLLFSSVPSYGLLWWISWLFFPRYLIAVMATFAYWYVNPILVALAWLVALGGESAEKIVVHRKIVRVKKMDPRDKYENVIDV